MKPCDRSAVLTREDLKIWVRLQTEAWSECNMVESYFQSDQRDADIMLSAQVAPLCQCCQEQMGIMFFDGNLIDIRGTVGT